MLEAIGEIGGIQQTERGDVQAVPLLRLVDRLEEQGRSCPAGVADGIALQLEPWTEQRDLSRAANAVGAFNGDEVSGQPPLLYVREAVAVPGLGAFSSRRH